MATAAQGPDGPRWRVRAAFDLVWTGGRSLGRPEAVRLQDAITATGDAKTPSVDFGEDEVVVSVEVQADRDADAVDAGLHAVQCACRYVPGVALGAVRSCAAHPQVVPTDR
jgi:hypothetical protein